jgi:PAB-dependent poly(A)-specific ribonuclease subunit 2
MRFGALVERSLNLKQQLSAFCNQCDKYTTTTQTRRILRMPEVLAVDVHIATDKDRAFWTTQQAVLPSVPTYVPYLCRL